MTCKTCLSLPEASKDDLLYQALMKGQAVASWHCPDCETVLTIIPKKGKPAREKKAAARKKRARRRRSR